MGEAIRVEGLGKKYRIGGEEGHCPSLRGTLTRLAKKPVERIRALMTGEAHKAMGLDREIWALKEIDFKVAPGEVVGIIGHNGSGKSTLLKILSRITEPTKGRAVVHGRVASLLEVGTGFHHELSGRENIYLNGSILGMTKREIDKKFEEIVEFSGVSTFIDTPVKHYSSGMYVRLAFSVAAHLEPEILIIDEVLAVGDVRFQKKCLSKMEDVSASGRTVLFVSHNMQAVQSLCRKAILLDQGTMIQEGKVKDVLGTYMKRCSSGENFREWDAGELPGNSSIKIHRMEAVNEEGEALPAFPISKPVAVRIHYEILEDGAHASFYLSLLYDHGLCAFSTINNQEKTYYGTALSKGHYISECVIPANMLNDCSYQVSLVGFSSQWSDPFTIHAAINIDTYDDGELKGDYFGAYTGCIRPRLEWRTCKQEACSEEETCSLLVR